MSRKTPLDTNRQTELLSELMDRADCMVCIWEEIIEKHDARYVPGIAEQMRKVALGMQDFYQAVGTTYATLADRESKKRAKKGKR
jgi:hypothetical protein